MYGLPVISSPEGPSFSQSVKCTHVSRMVVLRGLCPFYPPYPHRVVKMPLQYSPQSMIMTQYTTSARETCTCTNLLVRMSIFFEVVPLPEGRVFSLKSLQASTPSSLFYWLT